MKICPVEPKLFHVDGRMDGLTNLTELIAAFTVLCKHLKMVKTVCIGHGICLCCSMLTDRWTDRHEKTNSCFLKFFEHS
jgi:hypothetical protein